MINHCLTTWLLNSADKNTFLHTQGSWDVSCLMLLISTKQTNKRIHFKKTFSVRPWAGTHTYCLLLKHVEQCMYQHIYQHIYWSVQLKYDNSFEQKDQSWCWQDWGLIVHFQVCVLMRKHLCLLGKNQLYFRALSPLYMCVCVWHFRSTSHTWTEHGFVPAEQMEDENPQHLEWGSWRSEQVAGSQVFSSTGQTWHIGGWL